MKKKCWLERFTLSELVLWLSEKELKSKVKEESESVDLDRLSEGTVSVDMSKALLFFDKFCGKLLCYIQTRNSANAAI